MVIYLNYNLHYTTFKKPLWCVPSFLDIQCLLTWLYYKTDMDASLNLYGVIHFVLLSIFYLFLFIILKIKQMDNQFSTCITYTFAMIKIIFNYFIFIIFTSFRWFVSCFKKQRFSFSSFVSPRSKCITIDS